jgi:nuclear pore complex protein Nup133
MLGLFEKNSGTKPINPENALGAYIEDLNHRFTGLDVSIQETIKKDMQAEDEALARFIETCQLEKWYQAALDLAKRDVMEEINEETEDGEKMQEIADKLMDIEKQIAKNERSKAETILHSKPRYKPGTKLDGSVGNFRSSSRF